MLRKAGINLTKRREDAVMEITNAYKVKKDIKDRKNIQVLANRSNNKFHWDLEHLNKIQVHQGLSHSWGF